MGSIPPINSSLTSGRHYHLSISFNPYVFIAQCRWCQVTQSNSAWEWRSISVLKRITRIIEEWSIRCQINKLVMAINDHFWSDLLSVENYTSVKRKSRIQKLNHLLCKWMIFFESSHWSIRSHRVQIYTVAAFKLKDQTIAHDCPHANQYSKR
jgi:hypothetical protein